MQTIEGLYLNGRRPLPFEAKLVLGNGKASLIGENVEGSYPISALTVSPRSGSANRFISFPDGGQLQCADRPLLDGFAQASRVEGVVAWFEQRIHVALGCIAIVSALVLGGYFHGLPALAKDVAARIPIETEQQMGRDALNWLDQRKWFHVSRLPADKRREIEEGFHKLKAGLPYEERLSLEFRDSPTIGKNAFALPGGTIVITDDMVKAASTEEVLAILAHEIGHVELRHIMRHVLQDSAIGVLIAAVTSDAATLGVAVAGLPVLLAQAQYSRDFESEADEFAFALLKRRGYSPEAFATLMERLSKNSKEAENMLSFISTHPVSEQRIQRARDAAR